jgi:hypothetical protein
VQLFEVEIEDWKGDPFAVLVPSKAEEFWRLLTTGEPTADDFRPDSEVRDRFPTEDTCSYLGFSVWRLLNQATEFAGRFNPQREAADVPPFTHVVQIKLWPKKRHTCARIGPEDGHFVIWAPAEDFTRESRQGRIFPI